MNEDRVYVHMNLDKIAHHLPWLVTNSQSHRIFAYPFRWLVLFVIKSST
jgi:hypothetical protein